MAIDYGSPPGTYSDAFGKQLHDQAVAEYAKQVDEANQMIADANAKNGTNTPYIPYGSPGWKPKYPIVLKPGEVGGVIKGSQFGVTTPAGKTLTTAEKQAQNPLYNPLYDPSSAEYKANLVQISNPKANTPQITNPLAPTTTPTTPSPRRDWNDFPNIDAVLYGPHVNKTPAVDTSNLLNAVQNKNTVSTPQITLPQQFQQNFNATPGITPPTGTQGIKMPKFNPNAGFNTNWSDLFSVAHNRYTR